MSLLVVAGCGGKAELPGKLLVHCGTGAISPVYAYKDGRLTERVADVASFDARGGRVAVSGGQGVTSRGLGIAVDGRVVASGNAVALRDDGTLAFAREYGPDAQWGIFTQGAGGRARRVAGPFQAVVGQQWARDGLFALVRQNRGRYYVASDVGTPKQRLTALKMDKGMPLAVSPKGDLAYGNGVLTEGEYRLHIHGGRGFETFWRPLTWTPDSSRVLVQRIGTTPRQPLGLLDPESGEVEELETLSCGAVYAARFA